MVPISIREQLESSTDSKNTDPIHTNPNSRSKNQRGNDNRRHNIFEENFKSNRGNDQSRRGSNRNQTERRENDQRGENNFRGNDRRGNDRRGNDRRGNDGRRNDGGNFRRENDRRGNDGGNFRRENDFQQRENTESFKPITRSSNQYQDTEERQNLPPRNRNMNEISVPKNPPFLLRFASLSYETTEEQVIKEIPIFFEGSNVKNVRFIPSNSPKSFCLVEFHDAQSLSTALTFSGKVFLDRKCILFVEDHNRSRSSNKSFDRSTTDTQKREHLVILPRTSEPEKIEELSKIYVSTKLSVDPFAGARASEKDIYQSNPDLIKKSLVVEKKDFSKNKTGESYFKKTPTINQSEQENWREQKGKKKIIVKTNPKHDNSPKTNPDKPKTNDNPKKDKTLPTDSKFEQLSSNMFEVLK